MHFIIIGAGLTGTAMLYQLVEKIARRKAGHRLRPSAIRISVVERQAQFGPGFPHNEHLTFPFHIANMCVRI